MKHLLSIRHILSLLAILSTCQSSTFDVQRINYPNGIVKYRYDGKDFNTMSEVMQKIQGQNPNMHFVTKTVVSNPYGYGQYGGSNSIYGNQNRGNGIYGGYNSNNRVGPMGGISQYNKPGSIGGNSQYNRPSQMGGNSVYGTSGGQSPNNLPGKIGGNSQYGSYGGQNPYNKQNYYDGNSGYNKNWQNGGGISNGGYSKPHPNDVIYNPNNGRPLNFSDRTWKHVWHDYNLKADALKGYSEMKARFLKESNIYRKNHGAPQLTINSYLAKRAQDYANYLANYRKFHHDPQNNVEQFGENLGMASEWKAHVIVKRWYDECVGYNYYTNNPTPGKGHFTQLVWAGSTSAGFGIARDVSGVIYVVCKYKPRGNIIGYYLKNVFRPKE